MLVKRFSIPAVPGMGTTLDILGLYGVFGLMIRTISQVEVSLCGELLRSLRLDADRESTVQEHLAVVGQPWVRTL